MPSTGHPAENPIPRHRLPIGPEVDVAVQTASTRAWSAAPGHGRNAASTSRRRETFIDTAKHEPTPQGTAAEPSFVPVLSEAVEHQLQAIISLDAPRDTVHIDICGSLTRVTRAALLDVTKRIRKLRVSSHIRVHLGNAEFVESAALAGLRTDLEAKVSRVGGRPGQGQVTLETRPIEGGAPLRHALTGITSRPAHLDDFTKVDLLTASDFLFAWLDDVNRCPGTDVSAMLALFEHIGREISCRTVTRRI